MRRYLRSPWWRIAHPIGDEGGPRRVGPAFAPVPGDAVAHSLKLVRTFWRR